MSRNIIDRLGNTYQSQRVIQEPAGDHDVMTKKYSKRIIEILVLAPTTALSTGDGQAHVFIPKELNGHFLLDAQACLVTAGSSGSTIAIYNVTDSVDVLSTNITIDSSEKTSYTAATPSVVNSSYRALATGDELRIDVDTAGTSAAGLVVILVVSG